MQMGRVKRDALRNNVVALRIPGSRLEAMRWHPGDLSHRRRAGPAVVLVPWILRQPLQPNDARRVFHNACWQGKPRAQGEPVLVSHEVEGLKR